MTTTTEAPDLVERLTRPIIGIKNRTSQEAFDIMTDRIRVALAAIPSQAGEVERLRKRLEVVEGWSEDADGIACRDATIKLLDDKCETLRAQLAAKDAEIARMKSEPICSSCTTSPAPDKDLCPAHAAEYAARQAARAT